MSEEEKRENEKARKQRVINYLNDLEDMAEDVYNITDKARLGAVELIKDQDTSIDTLESKVRELEKELKETKELLREVVRYGRSSAQHD